MAGSVSMVAYPMQQLAAFRRTERRQSYGLRIKVSQTALLACGKSLDAVPLTSRFHT